MHDTHLVVDTTLPKDLDCSAPTLEALGIPNIDDTRPPRFIYVGAIVFACVALMCLLTLLLLAVEWQCCDIRLHRFAVPNTREAVTLLVSPSPSKKKLSEKKEETTRSMKTK